MRARSECRVNKNLKEDYVETALDTEATEDMRQTGHCSTQTESKHKHTDVTGEHECRKLTAYEIYRYY